MTDSVQLQHQIVRYKLDTGVLPNAREIALIAKAIRLAEEDNNEGQ